jgi:hypothetical protein
MKRHKIRYPLLVASVVLLTPIAIAQSVAPLKNGNTYDAQASSSIAERLSRGSGAMEAQSETITPVSVPANVLDGDPRDSHGEAPRIACNNDPLTGETQIPLECRRWLEIASSDFSRRLRRHA